MSGYIPFPVALFKSGEDKSVDPWLIPEDAMQKLHNGYQYRGIIYSRDGYSWFDQMPYALSANDNPYQSVASVANTTGPLVPAIITTVAAHGLTTGTIIRLINVDGITTQAPDPPLNGTLWTITVTGATTFTINNLAVLEGTYTASTGTVVYFPGNPITLITTWIGFPPYGTAGLSQLIVCDTKRAAYYDSTLMALVPIGNSDQWDCVVNNKIQQFWAENYFGKLFITNNNDNIFWWNNNPAQITGGMTPLVPVLGPNDTGATIVTCLMIRGVNNRLCLFNVVVSGSPNTRQQTTVYFCAEGVDPTQVYSAGPPVVENPWDQFTPGQGHFITATDSLYLISMAQVQYNLMVWSRGQTQGVLYQFRVNSDPATPFSFVKISDTRNVDSTFGTITLDRQVTAVGSTGLVTSDGNSVGRYDDKIPDFSLTNIDQDFVSYCYGLRFDPLYQAWILFTESGQTQNNKVAVFNYQDLSWYFYDISLTVLGNYSQQGIDAQWNSFGPSSPLGDPAWQDFTFQTWSTYTSQQNAPIMLGGDYNGYIWQMNDPSANGNDGFNNSVYQAPEIIGNPINFDLKSRQWAPFIKDGKSAQFGYFDVLIPSDPDNIYTVNFYVDDDPTPYLTKTFNALPNETDFIANVTNVTQANPAVVTSPGNGLINGENIWLYGVQGMTQINNIEYTITVIDDNSFSLNGIDSTTYTAYTSGGAIYTSGIAETLFWRRVWCGQQGTFHTLEFVNNTLNQYVEIHGLILGLKPTGRIFR